MASGSGETTEKKRWTRLGGALLDLALLGYPLGLVAWWLARWLSADGFWWLALANSFAVWLFLPSPLVLALALLARRSWLLIPSLLPLGMFALLYGPAFARSPAAAAEGATLVVMAYNSYGYNHDPAAVARTIRAERPDVIAFQELNPEVAALLEGELAGDYPYRALHPLPGVSGMGVASKLPLHDHGLIPLPSWHRWLQRATLDWNGRPITLLNVHAQPISVLEVPGQPWESIARSYRQQEQQTRELLVYARDLPQPLILAGDFNRSRENATAGWMEREYVDAFAEVGVGLGHTFPMPGQGRARGLPLDLPLTLRLDYVYHSRDLRPLAAWVGPWDGVSDHRPVLARLAPAAR